MSLIFIATFLLFPIFIFILMKSSGFEWHRFSLPSLVIIMMFLRAYIGVLPWYFGWDPQLNYRGANELTIILSVFLLNIYTILFMVLGLMFSQSFFSKNKYMYFNKPIYKGKHEFILLLFFFLICIFLMYSYLEQIQQIALFYIFSDVSNLGAQRSSMGASFSGGGYHWYNYFFQGLLPIISFSFYAFWLTYKSRLYFYIFIFVFIFASFSSMVSIEKGPMAWLLIGHFLVYVIIKNDGTYPIKQLIILSALLLSLLTLFFVYFSGADGVLSALQLLVSRVFANSIGPSYYYLEIFPEHVDFLMGRSFSNPGGLLPHDPYQIGIEVMNWINPHLQGIGITGSAPTVYWAEMYANFGYMGVFLPPFFVGIYLNIVSMLFIRYKKTPLMIAFFIWVTLHYCLLAVTGLPGFLIDIKIVFLFMVVIFIRFFYGKQELIGKS